MLFVFFSTTLINKVHDSHQERFLMQIDRREEYTPHHLLQQEVDFFEAVVASLSAPWQTRIIEGKHVRHPAGAAD